jgi:hypothetical protein
MMGHGRSPEKPMGRKTDGAGRSIRKNDMPCLDALGKRMFLRLNITDNDV